MIEHKMLYSTSFSCIFLFGGEDFGDNNIHILVFLVYTDGVAIEDSGFTMGFK